MSSISSHTTDSTDMGPAASDLISVDCLSARVWPVLVFSLWVVAIGSSDGRSLVTIECARCIVLAADKDHTRERRGWSHPHTLVTLAQLIGRQDDFRLIFNVVERATS
jgi:hypothetical protein